MCLKPKVINGVEQACRYCDRCVSMKIDQWTCRALAERDTSRYSYTVTLSYRNDENGQPPLGARRLNYADVQACFARIRAAGKRKWPAADPLDEFTLRYIAAGEVGTSKGRCHWHVILFSTHPLEKLGKFKTPWSKAFKYQENLDWSLWPHGFSWWDRLDRKSARYTCKYIQKGRFSAANSTGQGREGKTEWLAEGMFRMSKAPPIGAVWLERKLNDMVNVGTCPVRMGVRVPGAKAGDWLITGKLREDMCLFLHDANNEYVERRGRPLAGWTTLLGSLDEIENLETGEFADPVAKDLLLNGAPPDQEAPSRSYLKRIKQDYESDYAAKRRTGARIRAARKTVHECCSITGCKSCWEFMSDRQKASVKQESLLWLDEFEERMRNGEFPHTDEPWQAFSQFWKTRLKPFRFCQMKDAPELQQAIEIVAPLNRANPEIPKRGGIAPTAPKPTHKKRKR